MDNHINREFVNVSCIDKTNNCNIIKPGRLSNFKLNPRTGLAFTTQEIENINNQYNRICTQNNGVKTSCCDINTNENNLSETELDLFNKLKSEFPLAKLIFNNNNILEIIILVHRNQPNLHILKNEQGWQDLNPYIFCKLQSKNINLDQDGNFLIYSNLVDDCLLNQCETLEQELTMKTIIGDINFETKFSFLDDQAVETNILEGNFDAVKSYVLKYKTVNNSLTHNTEKIHVTYCS